MNTFKAFVANKVSRGITFDHDIWLAITTNEFDNFRTGTGNPVPGIVSLSPSTFVCQPPSVDLVRDFKREIKRDALQFQTFKDNAMWDNWNRCTIAQARAQDIAEVLDHTYIPSTQEDIDLFAEKQKFFYAVFEKTLLTDKGKALVRRYQHSYDAQLVYKELSDYYLSSTKATMNASSMLSYITSSHLADGKWKGSTQAFILHWQDQVRKYHDMSSQVLSNDILCTLLQNAVHPIAELRQVKVQADQFKTHTKQNLTYDKYCALLLSAAQQYNC